MTELLHDVGFLRKDVFMIHIFVPARHCCLYFFVFWGVALLLLLID